MRATGDLRRTTAFLALTCLASTLLAQTTPNAGAARGTGRGGGQPPASLATLPADAPANDPFWGAWPSTDPKVVGTRIVLNFLGRRIQTSPNLGAHYAEASTGYGSLRFAQSIGDKALANKIVARYATILTPEGRKAFVPPADHVDRSVFGIVPLEIAGYLTADAPLAQSYLAIGKGSADAQWAKPQGRDATGDEAALMKEGLTWQTRFWVDDMFMITGLQVQAFRATGDKVYLDRAAREMVEYLDKLQKPSGLFYHAADSPFYWGRGNGWFAVGMAEILLNLPADHPDHARILEGYKNMMAALLKNQGSDGMWHQLIDKPESWAETSSTGMFTFSMAVGVRKGWLSDPEYKAAARKAWIALCGYLDENANIREVCAGTNKAGAQVGADPQKQLQYYLDRPRVIGDLHGQAAAIWAAWAMSADIK